MFAVKTYVKNQPSPDPRLNHTMPDLADRHGLVITITQAYYCGIYSKSWINLQSDTRSRCEGTWRTRLWNSGDKVRNDSDLVTD